MGTVVKGSLQTGIQMKLVGARSVEDIRAGKFVVVEGERHEFFAMITDVTLDCVSPGVLADPPATHSPATCSCGRRWPARRRSGRSRSSPC